MENIQRTREIIHPNEWRVLESLSRKFLAMITEIFQLETLSDNAFPFRYKFTHQNQEYEFILSNMGSFTVRPISNIVGRRTSPIFYLSIGKYSGNFFWETEKQEIINIEKENLKLLILHAIQKYEASIVKFPESL